MPHRICSNDLYLKPGLAFKPVLLINSIQSLLVGLSQIASHPRFKISIFLYQITNQTICQGTFPVVNMGNNAEVAKVFHERIPWKKGNTKLLNKWRRNYTIL